MKMMEGSSDDLLSQDDHAGEDAETDAGDEETFEQFRLPVDLFRERLLQSLLRMERQPASLTLTQRHEFQEGISSVVRTGQYRIETF